MTVFGEMYTCHFGISCPWRQKMSRLCKGVLFTILYLFLVIILVLQSSRKPFGSPEVTAESILCRQTTYNLYRTLWKDNTGMIWFSPYSVDYQQKCTILLHLLSNPDNEYTIINLGFRGGLGHKFVSLMHSISFAILTHRNYLSDFRFSH